MGANGREWVRMSVDRHEQVWMGTNEDGQTRTTVDEHEQIEKLTCTSEADMSKHE